MPRFATPLLALFLMLVGLIAPPAHAQDRRVALVVGVDSYRSLPSLSNARADARAVAERLGRLGFEVVGPVLDPPQQEFIAALDRFENRLQGAALGLIFFAGHGVEVRGRNLLLPADAPAATSERQLRSSAIDAQEMLASALERTPRVVLILDACRDNPLPRDPARGGRHMVGGARGLERIDAPPRDDGGSLVVLAAAPGEVALDRLPNNDQNPNSVFTRHLIRALDDPTRPLPTLMGEVRDAVAATARQANRRQVPEITDRMVGSGSVVLAGAAARPAPVAPPAPAPPPPFPVGIGERFQDCANCPEMVVIPPGRFVMGSPATEPGRYDDEGPQRDVTLHSAIALGRGPVTVAEFRAFVQATGHQTPGGCWTSNTAASQPDLDTATDWRNPGFAQEDSHPVVCVSWHDAEAYVGWLSRRSGQRYRLPTEAEWEYAARAGTRTRWWWGDEEAAQCRHANGLDQRMLQVARAWSRYAVAPCNDGFAHTSPITQFAANRFGLHDMGGNVSQWTQDCYRDTYAGAPGDASLAVIGGDCTERVLRGRSWDSAPQFLRSAYRSRTFIRIRSSRVGFRVARTPGG